jgi:integrative and conjugative element protein (TIGR02256 family)
MIRAPVGISGETVLFTDPVLRHFEAHRQVRFWQREAGGLLFARLAPGVIRVEEVTGPRATDRRGRRSYQGDRRAEQREIDGRHADGLHYVGDWHTHPEPRPSPSAADEAAMIARVTRSDHQLRGLLFAIVGTAPAPDGLALFVHDGRSRTALAMRDASVGANF